MASAASSARIRASTPAISVSVQGTSSRVARSSSFLEHVRFQLRVGVHVAEDLGLLVLGGLLSRSAIWAGLSLRIRANGPQRSRALPVCPISGSNLSPLAESRIVSGSRRGSPPGPSQ